MINIKEKVDKKINEIVNAIVYSINPERIVLFGSIVNGRKKKGFDIDIYIELHQSLNKREERKLKELMDEISGIYTVDLVFSYKISADFRKIVYENGRVLYEKSRG